MVSEKIQDAEPLNQKKPSYKLDYKWESKAEKNSYPIFPPSPYNMKVIPLLKQWVKD